MTDLRDPTRASRIATGIKNLLQILNGRHLPSMEEYVQEEIAKLGPDRRMWSLDSLAPKGEKMTSAVFISLERFRARVRWGDFLLALRKYLEGRKVRRDIPLLPR
jgi:hypothetical protein